MATSIHHGPPGSFKSFTLVQRFAVDALEKGRVVVTNIRGFTSIDRVQDQFPDIKFPDSADLIFVSTEIEAGRQLMAGWFHWAPLRALILIDEGQRIYPDRRDFKLESLDKKIVPPGFDVEVIAIEIQDEYTGERHIIHRPEDVFTAFDMQRHFQWDVHLSTPNIAKIKSPIREVAECAYRHKSLGGKLPLFFKNTWYEFQHDAENAGKFANQIVGKPRKYKADEKIFACYQSTATGEHTESNADQSIFGDPKLKLLLFVIVCCIGVFIYLLLGRSSTPSNLKAVQPVESPVLQKTDSVRLVQNTV
ncbi:MAG: zonular occludens toxin domain-containing protein, partial [Methylobacter sp.]|nr:zonular occludens toxin domain-containing protein [Methylobacter sp.]